jgi:TrmH family RNA methyltransferase
MKKISSASNPVIKAVCLLARDARERAETKSFVAEGLRTCQTFIDAETKLLELFCTNGQYEKALTLAEDDFITVVTDGIMNKMSPSSSPSGLLGVFEMPPVAQKIETGIVLAAISDPGNMGTLIRTCAALGKKTVIVIEGVDPFNPKVVQASAGTLGMVNILRISWQQLLERKGSVKLYGLVVQGGRRLSLITEPHLLVIGNEAHGLPPEWATQCDELITLSMPGNAESLNAAIAGSIAMYVGWIA